MFQYPVSQVVEGGGGVGGLKGANCLKASLALHSGDNWRTQVDHSRVLNSKLDSQGLTYIHWNEYDIFKQSHTKTEILPSGYATLQTFYWKCTKQNCLGHFSYNCGGYGVYKVQSAKLHVEVFFTGQTDTTDYFTPSSFPSRMSVDSKRCLNNKGRAR